MTTWFNLYSFDVMGRLAFGKEYHMIENGKRHWALGKHGARPYCHDWDKC